jgi:hypothetical protein
MNRPERTKSRQTILAEVRNRFIALQLAVPDARSIGDVVRMLRH